MTETLALPANCRARVVGATALLHTPFSQPVRLWARQRGGLWQADTKEWSIHHTPALLHEFRSLCWALWPSGAAVAEPWKGKSGQGTPAKGADKSDPLCVRCSTPVSHQAPGRIADLVLCAPCYIAVLEDAARLNAPASQVAPAPSAETATDRSRLAAETATAEPNPAEPPNPTENPTTAQNLGTDAKAARRAAMRAALAQ